MMLRQVKTRSFSLLGSEQAKKNLANRLCYHSIIDNAIPRIDPLASSFKKSGQFRLPAQHDISEG